MPVTEHFMKLNGFTEDVRYKLTDMEHSFTSNFALCSCSYRQNPQCSRETSPCWDFYLSGFSNQVMHSFTHELEHNMALLSTLLLRRGRSIANNRWDEPKKVS